MSALRTTVLPVLRLLVWTAIAISLGWLAFGRADPATDTRATPSIDLTTPEVTVTRATVENLVTLQGAVSADPAVPVKATAAGQVSRLWVAIGNRIEQGAPVLDIVSEIPAAVPADPGAATPPPTRRITTVRAVVAGAVTTLDVLADQQVAVGDTVASVSPGTLTVTASLSQDQQFRLLTAPTVALVTVPGGPAPFDCAEIRIGQPPADAAPAAPDPYANGPPAPATGALTCRVPPGPTVFAGMSATVAVQAGIATDVLVLPVTAVAGSIQTGTVWSPEPDGTSTERPVTLGLTDGQQVEILDGLAEGERVLEFVPNTDVPADQPGPPGVVYRGPGG